MDCKGSSFPPASQPPPQLLIYFFAQNNNLKADSPTMLCFILKVKRLI